MPTANGGPRPGQVRRDERFGFPVRVRVNGGHEPGATPWEEETTTQDASGGGASFLVERAVSVGDVVRLQVLPPLPATFGPLELNEPSPPVYAVVRSSVLDSRGRRVGVKFFSDVEGLMPAAAPVPPLGTDDRRARERYLSVVHFVVQKVDASGTVVAEALVLVLGAVPPPAPVAPDLAMAERFARLALACVGKEYPNKIAHVLDGDADVKPPRELTPAFFGCYDWHSAVHGHWLLARLARTMPEAPFAPEARAALARALTPANVAAEVRYLEGQGRVSFERPYGLAWLLQLAAEIREWPSPEARAWSATLEPLETLAADRIGTWLPKLSRPIRVGEHSQTAFAFGLVLDWARGRADRAQEGRLVSRIRELYAADRECPLAYEPSGEDFLSPCLGEADLMRRILPPREYASWLAAFLPGLPKGGSARWLEPAVVTDPTDPKLAHLDGLNLSRAWMLEGMAAGLPPGDRRLASLRSAAAAHRTAGLRAVTGEHYEGGHWLGTFAVYLVSGRGLPEAAR